MLISAFAISILRNRRKDLADRIGESQCNRHAVAIYASVVVEFRQAENVLDDLLNIRVSARDLQVDGGGDLPAGINLQAGDVAAGPKEPSRRAHHERGSAQDRSGSLGTIEFCVERLAYANSRDGS